MNRFLQIIAALPLCLTLTAAAQQSADDAPTTPPDAEAEVYAPVARSLQQLRPGRTVLLREGSVLVRTVGRVSRNQAGNWLLSIDRPDNEQGPPLELLLMPCRVLEEMQRLVTATEGEQNTFEVTGEVFVYNDRNYFLPTHAPQIAAPQPNADNDVNDVDATAENEGTAQDQADADDEGEAAEPDADSAEAIMQRLRKKAGSVARSSAPDDAPLPLDAQRTTEASSLREGMSLMDRRGHLTRNDNGTWMFVFAADAEGLSDPPARVLPCLLLERMQDYARSEANVAPILLSGRVFEHRNRNYVLPTLYRVPHDRTPIVP